MTKDQWEEETIERFRAFLSRERGVTFAISGRDVVVDPATNENFDYQLVSSTGNKVAVEIFRLVESGEELASGKVWSQVVDLLKQELTKQGIKGYLIILPHEVRIPLREVKNYAEQAAGAITAAIGNNLGLDKFTTAGMTFRKIEQYETVSFSWGGEARWVNPHGTAETVFHTKLGKKNKQLGVPNHERILLVTNWAIIVDESDVVRALSGITFEEYPNVDKIFFETRNHRFSQVYQRETYDAILNKQHESSTDPHLLVGYLRHQLANKKEAAYAFVKSVTARSGSIKWLSDNETKANLVIYAQGLAEEGNIDEALWVIRQLSDDLDPDPNGENSPDDPTGECNSHLRILNGEEDIGIRTVRGHLCWLIAKVITRNKPEVYEEFIDILDQYLSEKNLYIRTQALIPLTELAARIRAIRNQDGSSFEWQQASRNRVKALAFRTLEDNASYPRVLQVLFHVFSHLRGINEPEAMTVLETFLATDADYILHDLAALVIYFALFREQDFPEDSPFKAYDFVELLKEQISSGKPSMKQSLAWHFWNCLHGKHLPLRAVREYLLRFWAKQYDQNLGSTFELLFEELIQLSPLDACEIFGEMIERLKEFGEEHQDLMREIWIHGEEDLMRCLAKYPPRLMRVVTVLVEAWKKGAFVYEIVGILESYRLVDAASREAVKAELVKLYSEIKVLKTDFPEIDWSR